jgi:hypothetical protein
MLAEAELELRTRTLNPGHPPSLWMYMSCRNQLMRKMCVCVCVVQGAREGTSVSKLSLEQEEYSIHALQ